MNIEQQVKEALKNSRIMQLATAVNDQPWICTVHFFADDTLNMYWCSEATRRHSKELTANNKASVYLLVHENTPEEDYVIGISLEGTAERIDGSQHQTACEGYVNKLGRDETVLKQLLSDEKAFYRFTPSSIVMFNNRDFPDNPRQEWVPAV